MAAPVTTDEHHSMAEEGRAVAVEPDDAGLPAPLRTEGKAGAAPPPAPLPPRPTEKTPAQAEKGVNAPREPCRTARAQENMEFGAGIAAFGVSMMVAWYFLSPDARGSHNLRYIIPILLCFSCFTSGICLMLLSMNILGLPESVVADVQDMTSKCLSWLCSILPVVTLLSPLVISGYKIYRYVGLTILVIVTAPIALLRWYIGRKAEGRGIQAALSEHKEQLEDAFKFISAISNSASAGLVALVVNYNVTGGSGCNKGAILAAIFFMFTTAVWGLLSMEIRAKVLEIKSTRFRGFIIQALWLAIIVMLLSLACAVFTEVYAIVEFWIFAAFTPCVFASAIYLFLENCIHQSRVPRNRTANVSQELEVQLNLKAERGIKVTMWSFMAIIGIFGGFLHGHDKIKSLKACIVLFTSAFMSGLSLTLFTIRPNLTSTSLAAATKALDWTAVATFIAAIFAIIVAMILEVL
ncbi:hypothetical protein PVAP13_4KG293400 [Panicum virgatum]|uniref:Uncharacterized protein n=1 Tax=Panicum virgatum TaxID=38727 RepID=A0A8T0TTV2_PANVG|nr:hypothetical protein PVAP13_4KG293400 [Panicum virgatum]